MEVTPRLRRQGPGGTRRGNFWKLYPATGVATGVSRHAGMHIPAPASQQGEQESRTPRAPSGLRASKNEEANRPPGGTRRDNKQGKHPPPLPSSFCAQAISPRSVCSVFDVVHVPARRVVAVIAAVVLLLLLVVVIVIVVTANLVEHKLLLILHQELRRALDVNEEVYTFLMCSIS